MKKRVISALVSVLLIVAVMAAMPLSVYADENVTVNGQTAKKGDTVTYTVYLGGISDPLEGAGAFINYDPKCLEYIEDSIGFDVFGNAMYNVESGQIYYSAIDVIKGFDLKEEKMIVTLSFKVLDSAKGNVTITNSFDEIFTTTNEAEDLTENDYTLREETEVSDTFTGNNAPNAGLDVNEIDEMQLSSDTSLDEVLFGTDIENIQSELQSKIAQIGSDLASSLNSSEATVSNAPTEGASSETTSAAASSEAQEEPETHNTAIIIIICVVFVILLIGALILSIFAKKKSE